MKTSIDYRKRVAIETTPQNEKEALSLAEECWALGCDERAEQLLQQVNDKSLAGDVLLLRAMMLSTQGGSVAEVQKLLTQAEAQGNPVAKLYNCLKAKDVKTDQLPAMAKDMPDWYLAQYCALFTPVEEYMGPAPTAQEADKMLQQAERDAAAAIKARKDEAESKAQEEASRKAKAEAERKAKEEAERKAAAICKAKEEAARRQLLALRQADEQQIHSRKMYLLLIASLFAVVEIALICVTDGVFIAAAVLSFYWSYRAIRYLAQRIPWCGIATPVRRFSLKFNIYASVAAVTLCSHILAYAFDAVFLYFLLYVLAIWITKKIGGHVMEKNIAQYTEENAMKYKKMAELGGAKEQFVLARLYRNGSGVSQDNAEAEKWASIAAGENREQAEQGEAEAQYNIGWQYNFGFGVTKDKAEAVKWFRKAAEQGNAQAQTALGVRYDFGEGVTQNYDYAVKWYRKAAEQGFAIAQYNLGSKYVNGEGVTQDYAEAVKWYSKASEQGYADGQYMLGRMYEAGKGVPQNKVEAEKWYKKAVEQGNKDARGALESLLDE